MGSGTSDHEYFASERYIHGIMSRSSVGKTSSDLDSRFSRAREDSSDVRILIFTAFSSAVGGLTVLHVLRADINFPAEFMLLFALSTVLAAWYCPWSWVLLLASVSAIIWYLGDLRREPDFVNCSLANAFRFVIGVLFVYLSSRARQMLDQARHLARIDGLTGLPNREAVLEALDTELCRDRRYRRSFSIAMLDCDDFKQINDLQGHIAGDRVLQSIAVALRKSTRAYDCVGRYGGDEFVMILSEVNTNEIATIIERVRAALRLELNREPSAPTFSIGVVTVEFEEGDERESLSCNDCLQRVDEVMYSAKRTGRDQTRFETMVRPEN